MFSVIRIYDAKVVKVLCRKACRLRLLIPKLFLIYRSVEMMGLIGAGNNPMVGMTVAVAVAIEEASK